MLYISDFVINFETTKNGLKQCMYFIKFTNVKLRSILLLASGLVDWRSMNFVRKCVTDTKFYS